MLRRRRASGGVLRRRRRRGGGLPPKPSETSPTRASGSGRGRGSARTRPSRRARDRARVRRIHLGVFDRDGARRRGVPDLTSDQLRNSLIESAVLPLGCSPETRGAIVESLKKLACADPGTASFLREGGASLRRAGDGGRASREGGGGERRRRVFRPESRGLGRAIHRQEGERVARGVGGEDVRAGQGVPASVVYVDDADLMFVADKKKAKALRAERGAAGRSTTPRRRWRRR